MPSRHPADPEEENDVDRGEATEAHEFDTESEDAEDESGWNAPRSHGRGHGAPHSKIRGAGATRDPRPKPSRKKPKRTVYWGARDSLWFEPLVALAIVVVLIVGLWAYTQNWPPVYVVESGSMQHGTNDQVGLINTGDLVLAQKINPNSVVPYMVGVQTGYSTYGEFGDVLLYHPNGDTAVTPVIHRAIVYLQHNPDGTWSLPDLAPLACSASAHPYYSISSAITGCGTVDVSGTLTLYGVGWQSVTVTIPLNSMGPASGFVTMGDNNFIPGDPGTGEPDQTFGISALVQGGWILGVARGMIPWFGAAKLLLEGDAAMVPSQSWAYMGISIAGLVLAGLAVHLAWRSRNPESDEGDGTGIDEAATGQGPRRWVGPSDSTEGRGEPHRPPAHTKRIPQKRLLKQVYTHKGGRPRPSIRRPPPKHASRKTSDD